MKKTTSVLLGSLVVLGFLGTGRWAEAKEATAKKAMAAPAMQTAVLDPAASQILWIGKKVTGSHNGTVPLKSGQVELKNGQLAGGTFEVDMTKLQATDVTDAATRGKLEGHLKSDDFFSVEKNPTATFKITKMEPIAAADAAKGTTQVSGDLTIKGQTHPVSFPATVVVEGKKATGSAKVVVDRTLYGIRYGSGKFFQNLGDKVIDDTFSLELKLEGNIQ